LSACTSMERFFLDTCEAVVIKSPGFNLTLIKEGGVICINKSVCLDEIKMHGRASASKGKLFLIN
jgi:hypothetical protein